MAEYSTLELNSAWDEHLCEKKIKENKNYCSRIDQEPKFPHSSLIVMPASLETCKLIPAKNKMHTRQKERNGESKQRHGIPSIVGRAFQLGPIGTGAAVMWLDAVNRQWMFGDKLTKLDPKSFNASCNPPLRPI